MKKILIILITLSMSIVASSSYKDKDIDGVLDKYDRCPNTPFFAIVNRKGCTVKLLVHTHDKKKMNLTSSAR